MLLHSNCPYCTSIAHKLHIKDYERFGEHTMNLKIWRLIRYWREIPWSITDTRFGHLSDKNIGNLSAIPKERMKMAEDVKVPEGWRRVRLGDVLKLRRRMT